jgi:hypothetical protein
MGLESITVAVNMDKDVQAQKLIAEAVCNDTCMHFKAMQQLTDKLVEIGVSKEKTEAYIAQANATMYLYTYLNLCAKNIAAMRVVWENEQFKTRVINTAINAMVDFGKIHHGLSLEAFPTDILLYEPIHLN